ncbi:hypothetical protein DFJ73DRAFT_774726 [Zopfochytrium polystomum]|nr:hypothetical protein DFJ73DRAFT_774726 [Zopfochytrium polystomum]
MRTRTPASRRGVLVLFASAVLLPVLIAFVAAGSRPAGAAAFPGGHHYGDDADDKDDNKGKGSGSNGGAYGGGGYYGGGSSDHSSSTPTSANASPTTSNHQSSPSSPSKSSTTAYGWTTSTSKSSATPTTTSYNPGTTSTSTQSYPCVSTTAASSVPATVTTTSAYYWSTKTTTGTKTRTQVPSIDQCPSLTPRPAKPTSVHDIRPDEIETIMGIGDSILAGFASRVTDLTYLLSHNPLYEYRGVNLATGGDSDSTSLGNLMKHYSPTLKGLSHGERTIDFCYGPICPVVILGDDVPVQGLSAAESGAWVVNWPPQIDYFKKHLPTVDPNYPTSFKFLTVMLAYNDMCLGCFNWTQKLVFEADQYETNLRNLMKSIRANVPRVVVSLVPPFDVGQIQSVANQSPQCKITRDVLGFECVCMDDVTNAAIGSRARMKALAAEYGVRARKIAKEFNALKDPGFAVVFDVQMGYLDVENGPAWLLSAEDCFHPSKKAHDILGINMWNNLFDPIPKKGSYSIYVDKVTCPTEDDRIYIDYDTA